MAHPYLMGFVKFAVLATIGELCAIRILSGQWKAPVGLIYRTIVWGVLGMGIVLMFEIFFGGVTSAIAKGLLPAGSGFGQQLLKAVFISTIMNLSFAPVFMAFHRFTDTCIDVACGEGVGFGGINSAAILARIDWQGFINFVVLKTVPFFWIPAHTITFLLPPEYRVLVAASLSIALGAILAYAKRKNAPAK
jgi:hypothetical protein